MDAYVCVSICVCLSVAGSNMTKRTNDVLLYVSLPWKQVFYSFIPSVLNSYGFPVLSSLSCLSYCVDEPFFFRSFLNTRCKLFIAFEWQIQMLSFLDASMNQMLAMRHQLRMATHIKTKKKSIKLKCKWDSGFLFFFTSFMIFIFFGDKKVSEI